MLWVNEKISGTIWLAMSRIIGDWGAKKVGVISEPLVDFVSLDDIDGDKVFDISVTDGMLD